MKQPTMPAVNPWPHTIAEVTVMDADRLKPMCIESQEPPKSRELARSRDKFRIKLAGGGGREGASILIEKMYSWRGYGSAGKVEELPNRITLNAEFDGQIYGTLTLNIDSPLGLSCEAAFPEYVAQLRAQGRKICEFGKFAVEQAVRSKRLLASLFHILYIYAYRLNGCTDTLIEVNPRHVFFYERYLGFKPMGEPRTCSRVGAPAVLLHLDFEHCARQIRALGGRWRELPDEKSLYKYVMSQQEEDNVVARLRHRVDKEAYVA